MVVLDYAAKRVLSCPRKSFGLMSLGFFADDAVGALCPLMVLKDVGKYGEENDFANKIRERIKYVSETGIKIFQGMRNPEESYWDYLGKWKEMRELSDAVAMNVFLSKSAVSTINYSLDKRTSEQLKKENLLEAMIKQCEDIVNPESPSIIESADYLATFFHEISNNTLYGISDFVI